MKRRRNGGKYVMRSFRIMKFSVVSVCVWEAADSSLGQDTCAILRFLVAPVYGMSGHDLFLSNSCLVISHPIYSLADRAVK
jgi:hypothetical protein